MKATSTNLIETYKEAGKIATEILWQMVETVEVGGTAYELELTAKKLCDKYQVEPAFSKVRNENGPYGYASCISINDTILHGIPSKEEILNQNDLVKLDFGIIYNDLYTDQCVTVGVEKLSKKNKKLISTTRQAVQNAVAQAISGNTTGDLGHEMEHHAKTNGFKVLKNYIGHGIGHELHEAPAIPAYGRAGSGSRLEEGMVICVEAQLVAGSDTVYVTDDSWTVKTVDGKNSAMFEYMVIVGQDSPTILTDTYEWPLIVS